MKAVGVADSDEFCGGFDGKQVEAICRTIEGQLRVVHAPIRRSLVLKDDIHTAIRQHQMLD